MAAILLPGIAAAHHGLDFLLVDTAHLPEIGTAYAVGSVDYLSADDSETEFEPALLYGATDWLTLELHTHFEKEEGESANFESISPAVHFRLTPRGRKFSFGLSVENEFSRDGDDEDRLEVTANFGYAAADWMVATNLLVGKGSRSSSEWGFAAGARRALVPGHALGIELETALDNSGPSEVLIGYYGELAPRFSLNAGLGTGVDGGPDLSLRTAFIWRFR